MIDTDEYESLLYDWKIRLTKEGVKEAKAHWFHENGEGLLAEVKRAYQLIVDAAWQLHWNVGTIASSAHLSSKEWDEDIYAPAQAWRRQVQEILDASEEGCPWKESEGE